MQLRLLGMLGVWVILHKPKYFTKSNFNMKMALGEGDQSFYSSCSLNHEYLYQTDRQHH